MAVTVIAPHSAPLVPSIVMGKTGQLQIAVALNFVEILYEYGVNQLLYKIEKCTN